MTIALARRSFLPLPMRSAAVISAALLLLVACPSRPSRPTEAARDAAAFSVPSIVVDAGSDADASVADADAAPPPVASPSCAPPKIASGDPPAAPATLEGLVELLRDPKTTLAHVKRDFGDPITVPGAERVTLDSRRVQNREYLTSVRVSFATQPTVDELARRFGMTAQVGKTALVNTCADGWCPSVSFMYGNDRRLRMAFEIDRGTPKVAGSLAVGHLRVRQLYFDVTESGCHNGADVTDPTMLAEPRPGPEEELSKAVLAVAKVLQGTEPLDKDQIKKTLSPYGNVNVDHNTMTNFTWVRVTSMEQRANAGPLCFPGFRYVQDRELICAVTNTRRHLYEIDGTKTHRIFLIEELSTHGISRLVIERMPRNWKDPVF